MIQTYTFCDGGERKSLQFDDSKSVKELIQFAFDEFDYYEPFGMEIVTIYQSYHAWFTTDVTRSCAEEIVDRDWLCFAYYMPGVFYFAEGGWGHHMEGLGNHPLIANPVSLKLRFEDFRNTVVFSGKLTLREVIQALIRVGYVEDSIKDVEVFSSRFSGGSYTYRIDMTDKILDAPLTVFEKSLPEDCYWSEIVLG